MSDFCLSPAVPADYPELRRLWLATPGMGLNDYDDSPQGLARFLDRNPATCFTARRNGVLVGCILSGHDGRRGYIYHLAVAENCRRQGIGRQLVEAALAALGREGIAKAALVVFADNESGNQFWQRMGFTLRPDLNYRNRIIHE